jgi:hypothetical protein
MGTYLDVGQYPAIDAQTDAPHRCGARLGIIDVSDVKSNPLSNSCTRGKQEHIYFLAWRALPSVSKLFIGNQWGTLTREPYTRHLSNRRGLWESKIPRNQLPFRRVTKVTSSVPKASI